MIDASMIPDFIIEAQEHLEKLESSLLKLESGGEQLEIQNEIFRDLHTLKGAAQLVGIARIAELAHKLENLLDSIRQGKKDFDQSIVNIFIDGKDRLSALTSEMAEYREEKTDISDLISRIHNHVEGLGKADMEGEDRSNDEIILTEDFKEMFSNVDDIGAENFTENVEVIAALSDEKPEHDSFPGQEITPLSPALEQGKASGKTTQKKPPAKLDISTLKNEIEDEEYDEELFQIFIKQLQDNLLQLRILTDTFTKESNKIHHVNQCSDLISKLHSSANYMGYDHLTDFYGQWIAELEMIGLEMSTGSPGSFEFMDANIAKVIEIFPRLKVDIEEIPSEASIKDEVQEVSVPLPMTPSPSDDREEPLNSTIDEEEPDDFKKMFSKVDDISERDFTQDTTVIAALSGAEPGGEEHVRKHAPAPETPASDPGVIAALANEKPVIEPDGNQEPLPGLEEKLDFFFAEKQEAPSPAPEQKNKPAKPSRKSPPVELDINGLQDEIENEEYDEELFQIFIEQLQENISQLRTLTDGFAGATNKAHNVGQCSELISILHASANYMGYDRLADFYGQWLAQLDMIDLELATGKLLSFDFMNINIAKVKEIFPQVTDIVAKEPFDEETLSKIPPLIPPAPAQEIMPEKAAAAFTDEFDQIKAVFAGKGAEKGEEKNSEPDTDLAEIPPALLGETEEDELLENENEALSEAIDHFTENFPAEETEYSPTPLSQSTAEFTSEKEEQETADTVFFEPPHNDLPEVDLRRKNLLEQLSGEVEALKKEPDTPEQEETDLLPLMQREIKPDEHDNDLFAIYAKQVWDGISTLRSLIDGFTENDKKQPVLDQCIDILDSLRSSSSYMDYEHNAKFYRHWCDNVTTSKTELAEGKSVLLDYMAAKISLVTHLFPPSSATPDEQPVLDETALITPPGEVTDLQVPSDSPADDQHLFDKLSSALEEDDEEQLQNRLGTALDEDNQQHLFDRLSNALELGTINQQPKTLKPIDDVINEILSGDGLAKTVSSPAGPLFPSPKKISPPIMDLVSPGAGPTLPTGLKADLRTAGADRRKHFVDRRQGIEDRRLDEMAETPQKRQSIRVNADKINSLMNQVGELVVSKSYISQLSDDIGALEQYFKETGHLSNEELQPLKEYVFKLNQANIALGRVSSEIQDGVMQVRMLPIEYLFKRYPRLVRDLVYQADKKIDLVIIGENTELDKTVIEEIADPLMHIIRNSIDHGIETVEERKQAGKEETATLRLEAYPDGSDIIIKITDDGRGIDPAKIKEKALEEDLFTEEELNCMAEQELLLLIMTPGFTTAEQTTKTSGRGMGMDIAKTNINRLNGTIDIESIVGRETMIRIKIPMTLAIIQTLSVKIGSKILTIPLTSVVETARIKQKDISTVEGIEIIEHRDTPLPILRLAEILNIETEVTEDNHLYIAIVSAEGQRAGLIVDQLVGKDEAVIKPLAGYLRKESGFSGATIKGDGSISLILDIPTLLNIVKERQIAKHKKKALNRSLKGLTIA